MQTGYYAKSGKDDRGISISRGIPKWFKGEIYTPLAPSWQLIRVADPVAYTEGYYETVLNKLKPDKVLQQLGPDAIMLCYEKPGDFCHRRIVADWFKRELGLDIPEFDPTEGFRLTGPSQVQQRLSLFP